MQRPLLWSHQSVHGGATCNLVGVRSCLHGMEYHASVLPGRSIWSLDEGRYGYAGVEWVRHDATLALGVLAVRGTRVEYESALGLPQALLGEDVHAAERRLLAEEGLEPCTQAWS